MRKHHIKKKIMKIANKYMQQSAGANDAGTLAAADVRRYEINIFENLRV